MLEGNRVLEGGGVLGVEVNDSKEFPPHRLLYLSFPRPSRPDEHQSMSNYGRLVQLDDFLHEILREKIRDHSSDVTHAKNIPSTSSRPCSIDSLRMASSRIP